MNRADYLNQHRERRQAIADALSTGKTQPEVATAFGISRARVAQIAKQMGLPPRRGGRKPRAHGHA